jgi:phosphoribosyl 1,2-cyclic phosphodiesterase
MGVKKIFLNALGSGSSGNAFYMESPDGALLVDLGFSCRELLNRMDRAGCDPRKLGGVLLTHAHGDHSSGARVFCDKFNLPLYTTPDAAAMLMKAKNLPKIVRTFEPGAKFELPGFKVTSFSVSHDVTTVGFQLESCDVRVGFATDLGYVSANVKGHLRHCHALVIESNYDMEMLMNSDRRLELKRRIFGSMGHLGNKDTAQLLEELLDEESRLILFAHVSRECNNYDMVSEFFAGKLREFARENINFSVLRQEEPSERFTVSIDD